VNDAYLFAGPTLSVRAVEEHFGLAARKQEFVISSGRTMRFLPPASEGDVLRLLRYRPSIIGIIDGFFESVPAIWHKEILYAMSKGVHVLGAASMGALRAAELATYGMEGIGHIYEAYATGLLEDDDEVAVAHGPAELGYPAVSEAMINVRGTLADAAVAGVLAGEEATLLTRIAKSHFYKERTYNNIIKAAAKQGVNHSRLSMLEKWLEAHRVDRKHADALELVGTIFGRLNRHLEKKQVLYHMESTVLWKGARTASGYEDTNAS
jgi:hypothetical protein